MQNSRPTTAKYELSPDAKLKFHPVAQIRLPAQAQFIDHAFSPDGSMLAVAFGTFVWLYAHSSSSDTERQETWSLRSVFTSHHSSARITCLHWSGISLLIFGFSNGYIAQMRANSKETILRGFQVSEYPITSVEIDSEGRYMAILAGKKEVGFWAVAPDAHQEAYFYLPPPDNDLPINIRAIHWLASANKPTILVAYEHQGIIQWILNFDDDDASIQGPPTRTLSPITCGIFAPDGRLFLTPKATGGYFAYDLAAAVASRTLPAPLNGNINPHRRIPLSETYAEFLFGGEWLVGLSGSGEKLYLWHVKNRVIACQIPLGEVHAVAGRISACGILRGNAMCNVRIATYVSGRSGERRVIIHKAFLQDEGVDVPIVLTPTTTHSMPRSYVRMSWALAGFSAAIIVATLIRIGL